MENFQGKYNIKSTAVKRLMREALELKEATEDYCAHPLEDNLFEWHFTIRGPPDTEFAGGIYHGRILLPTEYPMKPPNIILLTPNGRFEVNKKICLSISGHHPETWQPSWSIRTALLALIAFMPTPGSGTIGSLDFFPEERQLLARKSHLFICPECGRISDNLLSNVSKPATAEEKSLIDCVAFKGEEASDSKVKEEASQSKSLESDTKGQAPLTEPSTEYSDVVGEASSSKQEEHASDSNQKPPVVSEEIGVSSSSTRLRVHTQSVTDTSTGSVPHNSTAHTSNINIVDRHRNLIIGILVTAIGFLILRRIILI